MKAKKFLGLFLAFVMISAMFAIPASAYGYDMTAVDDLNSMGLFLGTDEGYELEREPTRIETAVMLIRLLGKETAAKENNYKHPFTDVPEWADAYVGYLYENGLTKGVGDNKFGTGLCTGKMFCAFVLRALGYTEDNGDFAYDEAIYFAKELGLIDSNIYYEFMYSSVYDWDYYNNYYESMVYNYEQTIEKYELARKDGASEEQLEWIAEDIAWYKHWIETYPEWVEEEMQLLKEYYPFERYLCVAIMYNALLVNIKGTETTLLEKLIAEKAVEQEAAAKFMEKFALADELNAIIESLISVMTTEAMSQPFSLELEQISVAFSIDIDEEMLEEMRLVLSMLKEEDGYTIDDFITYLAYTGQLEDYSYEEFMYQLELMGITLEEYISLLESIISGDGGVSSTSTMSLTVVGEDSAFFMSSGYTSYIAIYYKDGYMYLDMYGQKAKQEAEMPDVISELIGLAIDPMLSIPEKFNRIEKIETDENIIFVFEASQSWYDTITTIVFTPGVAGLSIQEEKFDDGELYSTTTTTITFITGDDITIDFPDFSEYEEVYG